MGEVKLANWFLKALDLHENCENYECGCDPDTMTHCLAGIYDQGLFGGDEDLAEFIEEHGLDID